MNKYLRIYKLFIINSISKFMAHRFNFLMGMIANIVWTIGQIIAIAFLFEQIPDFAGWSMYDLIFLLGINQVYVYSGYVIYQQNLSQIPKKLLHGEFDRILTRPISPVFFLSFENLQLAQLIPLTFTVLPTMLYGLSGMDSFVVINIPFALTILTIGIITMYFFELSLIGLSFFFVDTNTINETVVAGAQQFSRLPFEVFPAFISGFLTFIVPIGFVAYYPTQILRDDIDSWLIIFPQVIILIIFIFTSYVIWKIGLKKYTGVA